MLEATAAARPDAPALTDRAGTFTYAQVTEAVVATAAGLIEHGLRRGDRVAVWLPKRSEKAIALYGAMRAGGVAVPINTLLKAPQTAHILRDSGRACWSPPRLAVRTSFERRPILTGYDWS